MMSQQPLPNPRFVSEKDFEYQPTCQSWIVVFAASLFLIYQFMQMSLFNSIASPLMSTFNIDAVRLGDLSSFYFLSTVVCLFFAGVILDRSSIRIVMLTTMTICVVSIALFSITSSFDAACFYRFLMGIANAFALLAVIQLSVRWFPPKKMALLIGLIFSIAMLGSLLAQTPFAFFVEQFDWRVTMQIDAGLGVVFLLFMAVFVKDYPEALAAIYLTEKAMLRDLSIVKTLKMTYCSVKNWLLGLCVCFLSLPVGLLGGLWGILFVMQIHRMSLVQASDISAILFLGVIVSAPISGWISDKLLKRRNPMLIGAMADFRWAMWIFPAALLLAVVMIPFLPETVRSSQKGS